MRPTPGVRRPAVGRQMMMTPYWTIPVSPIRTVCLQCIFFTVTLSSMLVSRLCEETVPVLLSCVWECDGCSQRKRASIGS